MLQMNPKVRSDVFSTVFSKFLINFMLRRFSDGETSYGEVKLKNRLLFMLDEFPVLGHFPFLVKTMGILAGYGINFFLNLSGAEPSERPRLRGQNL